MAEPARLRQPAPELGVAMVHLYRGEVQRANAWRGRLDTTTNWAVVTTGAGISFALAEPTHHHAVIILNTVLVTLFLWIEARRYRYYELWNHRVRLLEAGWFAPMLGARPPATPDWADQLAASLRRPEFPISTWVAFACRCRRNYVWLFLVLALAWVVKGVLHPAPAASLTEFVARSALGPVPGSLMLVVGVAYNGLLVVAGLTAPRLARLAGEVLPVSPGGVGPDERA
jgi:uncharacterized membrane protein